MIQFRRIDGAYGIPVFFQQLPEAVNPFSIRWIMFTGSADDRTVGDDGIYHWFEHVPFRGTKKYPNGPAETADRYARYGGLVTAETGLVSTTFWAHVPKRFWREALDVTANLVAEPMMTDAAITAEREIIVKERRDRLSDAFASALYHLFPLLWGDHPLGHLPIGSEAAVSGMTPELLRRSHARGYARSRTVLFVAGDCSPDELREVVAESASALSNLPLTERRAPASYGELPSWECGNTTEIETPFQTSVVFLLFPVASRGDDPAQFRRWTRLEHLLTDGDTTAPLLRITREERQLVYGAEIFSVLGPDGGFWGFLAGTEIDKTDALREAFRDVLQDAQPRDPSWYEYSQDAIRSTPGMRVVDPHAYTKIADRRLTAAGEELDDETYVHLLTGTPHQEVVELLDALTPDRARTIIFLGTGQVE
ncbi:MAG: Peptidase M16 domain protein [Parcubacteria group bacterium Gr01-1014_38]|nr:MAG: Peptidase M16 domain protein [Parcubacteria group bacterium Gr01-1014_38]